MSKNKDWRQSLLSDALGLTRLRINLRSFIVVCSTMRFNAVYIGAFARKLLTDRVERKNGCHRDFVEFAYSSGAKVFERSFHVFENWVTSARCVFRFLVRTTFLSVPVFFFFFLSFSLSLARIGRSNSSLFSSERKEFFPVRSVC